MPRHYDEDEDDLYENPYAESDTDADDEDVEVYENPASVVRTARDERLWRMAKASAARQGRAREWPYVMGIFQRMKQRTGSEPVENPDRPKIREVRSTYAAYDLSQVTEGIAGDVLVIPSEGVVGVADTWPVAVTQEHGELHGIREDIDLARALAVPGRDYDSWKPEVVAGIYAAIEEAERRGFPLSEAVRRLAASRSAPPAPTPPTFQLRASAVQQPLFGGAAFESVPKPKKKLPPPVDTRQRDLFGLPIDDDKPRENPRAEENGRYRYVMSCPGSTYEDIQALQESEQMVSRATFAKAIGPQAWREAQANLGYDRDFPITKDWHVGYYKGVFRGVPCYFLRHSRIEHIYTLDGKLGPSLAD